MSNVNPVNKSLLLGYLIAFLFVTATFSSEAANKGLTATFDKPVAEVQKAAVTALTVIGCEIKKDEPLLVQGVRKRKFGVMVGSGGEIVTATLVEKEAGKTDITVATKKTFVGAVGQKNWDQTTLDEINKALTDADADADAAAPVAEAPPPADSDVEPALAPAEKM